MRDDELRNLVDEILYLVEIGSGSPMADESELAHLLDRLALAMRHVVAPAEPGALPPIPARDREVLAKVAASRFPSFGAYNRAAALTGAVEQTPVEAVLAVEDVTTIADALHVVSWLWRNAGWEAGLWYLAGSHAERWGEAARSLQLYLHVRQVEREREETP